MKTQGVKLAMLIVSLSIVNSAFALSVPADWKVKDKAASKKFFELFKEKEKFLRAKNLTAYLNSLPQFMSVTVGNQIKSMHWDDAKAAEVLSATAMPEATVNKLKIIGFKQEDPTAALILKNPEKSGDKITYRLQAFYFENATWKVGTTMDVMKTDKENLDTDLAKIEFYKTLPAAPPPVNVAWVDAMYDIGPIPAGIKLEWNTNAVLQAPIEARDKPFSGSGIVLGGLKPGANTVEVIISKLVPKAKAGKISMKLRKATKGMDDYQKTVPWLTWEISGFGKKTKTFEIK